MLWTLSLHHGQSKHFVSEAINVEHSHVGKDVGCDFAQLCSGNGSDYRLTDEGHFVFGVAIFVVDMSTLMEEILNQLIGSR